MKTVSRLTYTFWSLFYHSLCLCGLIWQVTQISINFFQFDVNKDIDIRMPSEFDYKAGKSVYLCFYMDEFFDQEQFRDLMLVWSESNETDKQDVVGDWQRGGMSRSVAESFSELATVGEIFQTVLNESIINQSSIIEILFKDQICFTSSERNLCPISSRDEYTKEKNRDLDDVTSIFVALGNNYPYFVPQSLIEIDYNRKIERLYPHSYSYNIIKKEFPYSDKCYEYRLSKIVNRYEAMIKCNEELEGNKFASYFRIISKNDSHLYNLTRSPFYEHLDPDCDQQPPDCNRTVHFTYSENYMRDGNVSDFDVLILPKEGKEPSFTLVSKPRIDNIDYVTYILGALGSWLGFSFLGINPVPYLLTVAKVTPSNQVQDLSNQSNNSSRLFSLSNRVDRNETKCNESKVDFESKIEQQNQRIDGIYDGIIRNVIAEINSLKQN